MLFPALKRHSTQHAKFACSIRTADQIMTTGAPYLIRDLSHHIPSTAALMKHVLPKETNLSQKSIA
jgi:hypothetical protein